MIMYFVSKTNTCPNQTRFLLHTYLIRSFTFLSGKNLMKASDYKKVVSLSQERDFPVQVFTVKNSNLSSWQEYCERSAFCQFCRS